MKQGINDYLLWMMDQGYAHSVWRRYKGVLERFLFYVNALKLPQENIFTWDTLKAFRQESGLTLASPALIGFSRYLFEQKRIPYPIQKPRDKLPEIYEEYLIDYEKTRQVHPLQILCARRTLSALNDYLQKRKVPLPSIRIEHLDDFWAEYTAPFTPITRQNHRSCLRYFLRYLYQDRKILKRDLSSLLVGAPLFAQAKPPKFLRLQEVQKLFAGLKLSTPKELRIYAMLHLASP